MHVVALVQASAQALEQASAQALEQASAQALEQSSTNVGAETDCDGDGPTWDALGALG